MAGDWIKMRNNLWDDPRVSRICDLTESLEATVIGGLYWLWSCADEHTSDGYLPGLTPEGIDRKTRINGFGHALCAIDWIAQEEGGIRVVRFAEHNGASAKRRSMEARRKGAAREVGAINADDRRKTSACDADTSRTECGTREEKNIKDKTNAQADASARNPSASDADSEFDAFWSDYPKKKSKGDAIKAWNKIKPNQALQAEIREGLNRAKASHDWTKESGKFIPYPASWLRAMGWQDEETAPSATPGNGSGVLTCEYQDRGTGDTCGLPNAQPCKAYHGKALCAHHATKVEDQPTTRKSMPQSMRETMQGMGLLKSTAGVAE